MQLSNLHVSLLLKCRFFSILFQATFSVLSEKVILKAFDKKKASKDAVLSGGVHVSLV